MENKLIIIGGLSGSGKSTVGSLLSEALSPSAWIDSDDLVKVSPWIYGEQLLKLGVENAVALAKNFWRAGYSQVVLSGGPPSQRELDLLITQIHTNCHILYIWLDVNKTTRDKRRIARSRDTADKVEFLDAVDAVMTDPGKLTIPNGTYFRLQIDDETPREVLERIVKILAKEGLRLKDV
ncbi:MAG: hypothetical protein AAF629_29390 [Chloroflexota bacterium]